MGCTESTPRAPPTRAAPMKMPVNPLPQRCGGAATLAAQQQQRRRRSSTAIPPITHAELLAKLQTGGKGGGPHPFLQRYSLAEHLGSGGHGQVFKCYKRGTRTAYAVKYAPFAGDVTRCARRAVDAEARVYEQGAVSQNLMRIVDMYCGEAYALTVMELLPATLRGGMMCSGQAVYNPEGARAIIAGVVQGAEALHARNIAHLDIKPDNIMLSQAGLSDNAILPQHVKLIDYGSSSNFVVGRPQMVRATGTPYYAAPEVLKVMLEDRRPGRRNMVPASPYSEAADVWAVGVLCYYLHTGRHPFVRRAGGTLDALYACTSMGRMAPLPEGCDLVMQDFITRCLEKDPACRPTMFELVEHPFVASGDWDFETVVGATPRLSTASSYATAVDA